jgi:hypothetical protein
MLSRTCFMSSGVIESGFTSHLEPLEYVMRPRAETKLARMLFFYEHSELSSIRHRLPRL